LNDNNFLRELLEKILFNEKDLTKLKTSINQLLTGTLSSREFKQRIIHFRTFLLEELMKFYPYYLNQYSEKVLFSNDQSKNNHQQQLEQRDSLLETIGTRLQSLYEKLSS
jgi:hypothetical protein